MEATRNDEEVLLVLFEKESNHKNKKKTEYFDCCIGDTGATCMMGMMLDGVTNFKALNELVSV